MDMDKSVQTGWLCKTSHFLSGEITHCDIKDCVYFIHVVKNTLLFIFVRSCWAL